jgi:hypothetical protein
VKQWRKEVEAEEAKAGTGRQTVEYYAQIVKEVRCLPLSLLAVLQYVWMCIATFEMGCNANGRSASC